MYILRGSLADYRSALERGWGVKRAHSVIRRSIIATFATNHNKIMRWPALILSIHR
jgi:hypothetical protein